MKVKFFTLLRAAMRKMQLSQDKSTELGSDSQ